MRRQGGRKCTCEGEQKKGEGEKTGSMKTREEQRARQHPDKSKHMMLHQRGRS